MPSPYGTPVEQLCREHEETTKEPRGLGRSVEMRMFPITTTGYESFKLRRRVEGSSNDHHPKYHKATIDNLGDDFGGKGGSG